MIPDIDIRRSAWILIKRHGADATVQAAIRADALLAEGDLDGCAVWKRIIVEINRFQAEMPVEGSALH